MLRLMTNNCCIFTTDFVSETKVAPLGDVELKCDAARTAGLPGLWVVVGFRE